MKVNTIVVGFDGSNCARVALDAAAELVSDEGIVHVVTAFDAPSIRQIDELYSSVPDEFLANVDMLAGERAHLEEAGTFFDNRGVAHAGHFVDDDAASAILDIAAEVHADLIVVGSRGLGRATRFVRGSVSAKVANHAKTAFMVVLD